MQRAAVFGSMLQILKVTSMKNFLSVLLIVLWLVTGWVAADEPYG